VPDDVMMILLNVCSIIGYLGVTRAVASIFAKVFSILIQIPAVIDGPGSRGPPTTFHFKQS